MRKLLDEFVNFARKKKNRREAIGGATIHCTAAKIDLTKR